MRCAAALLPWLAVCARAETVVSSQIIHCDDANDCEDASNMLLLQVSLQLNTSKAEAPTHHADTKRTVAGDLQELDLRQLRSEMGQVLGESQLDVKLAAVVIVVTVAMTLWFLRSSADSAGQGVASDEASFFACYFIVFMDAFGFGIFAPFVPVLAKTFGMNARSVAGLLTAFSFAQAFNTPVFGYLSDRIGRRKVLLIAVGGEVLAYTVLSCARTFTGLLMGYAVAGAASATIGVCNAYIADITTEDERPVRMAHVNGSIALGIMTGPMVGGLISDQGFASACRICSLLAASNLTFTCFCLNTPVIKAPLRPPTPKNGDKAAESPSMPALAWVLCVGAFLGEAGMAAWESCAALYLMDRYFWAYPAPATSSSQFFAGSMAATGVTVIFVTVFLFPCMNAYFKQWYTVCIGTTVRITGFVCLAVAPTKWIFLMGQGMICIGDNLGGPNQSSLLTEVAGPSAYGTCLGAQSAFQAMARVFGPIIFASLYEDFSHSAPWLVVAALGLISASLWFYAFSASRQQLENDIPAKTAA
ncbi:unnamed protein product [Effrenium voratum]|uniref:Major facilitator superfamily (MFS) profile domain-containing protein n=1 Tax=Effrenium voratum TaxID=2562239 RepID=A0AA36JHK7_9DINO|nr:unnamed protein product [Effrenium voratum]CAJ1415478.1 unnamed protein product [Effrenium voratum]|mmetsp:Transcript_98912/g.235965  ORF Transcript_98912/g.235965 Transcript_98912/m.235965 type:complete len:532 (+) Transcript_98912:20-1615(+)